VGGIVAGGSEGARQLLDGQPDANRIDLAVGFGLYAGAFDSRLLAATVGFTRLAQAIQDLAGDVLSGQRAEDLNVPAVSAPASSGGK